MRDFKIIFYVILFHIINILSLPAFETDTIRTSSGDLIITFIGHGTLMFEFDQKIIHIDPVSRYADYSHLPQADIILITHHHGDHFDTQTVEKIAKKETKIICTGTCFKDLKKGILMKYGDSESIDGIRIEAVPAYNLVHKRDNGQPYHSRGEGNGYILTFGAKRVYIAGDTENFPEMKDLTAIDIAFLPMNLPYTMTPAMVAAAVRVINPQILYPYHFGNTEVKELLALLKDKSDCEIRIRKMN